MHFFNISPSKSGPGMVCFDFLLQNVFRATTACNFSFLIWPPTSAPAALASLLLDGREPQNIGKHSVPRLSYLFAHLHLLCSDLLLFSLLTFSTSECLPLLIISISDLLPLLSSPFRLSPRPSFFLAVLFICPYCRKFHL